jgi:hypothetical protein
MKNRPLSIFAALCIPFFSAQAQYTTPGTGISYTMDALVQNSGGVVTGQNGNYLVSNNITISTTDTLLIITNDSVLFQAGVQVDVSGVMYCNPSQQVVFRANDTTAHFKGFRFTDSHGSILNNASIEFAGGNKVIGSNMTISNSRFYKNNYSLASGALDIFGCNPMIFNCIFERNERSAIMTAVNAMASPTILNCRFIHNSTLNTNRPQLNLGAGSTNPLIIRGNYVEGAYSVVGGISVFLLTGGTMTVVIDSNTVINNRYGINIQGAGITYTITNNRIFNNNLETNPMNGGSGISFNGINTGLVANNLITGSLWGITILNGATPNLGQLEPTFLNIGMNHIYNNGNNGQVYNLYNNTPNPIKAENNYWGTNNQDTIEMGIFHQPDNASLGLVDYLPYYQISNENQMLTFYLTDGIETAEGVITDNQIWVGFDTFVDLSAMTAIFTASERATVWVDSVFQIPGITINDFTDSVVYTVRAENGATRNYTVRSDIAPYVGEIVANVTIFPNPARDFILVQNTDCMKTITLFGIDGKEVQQWPVNSEMEMLKIDNLHSGLYLLRIESTTSTHIRKLIINQ